MDPKPDNAAEHGNSQNQLQLGETEANGHLKHKKPELAMELVN